LALAITTTTLDLPATQPVLAPLEASGNAGPVRWSLMSGTNMPGGLRLNSTGWIEGTAGISGTFSITVSAFDTGAIQQADGGAGTQVPGPTVGADVTLVLS
jgi:hypothetical protein